MVIYDPYLGKTLDLICFPGLSNDDTLHASGIKWHRDSTGNVSIIINAAQGFLDGGATITGANWLVKYDLVHKCEVYRVNLNTVSKQKYAGFQDLDFDAAGNTYVIGSFRSSIIKIDPQGQNPRLWWGPENLPSTQLGLTDIAIKDGLLLSTHRTNNTLVKFNLNQVHPVPSIVLLTPQGYNFTQGDGARLHPKYNNRVMLIARNDYGVDVLRSKDGSWATAEYLGSISNVVGQYTVTQSVQVGNDVFVSPLNFEANDQADGQSEFPLGDITKQVDALLN